MVRSIQYMVSCLVCVIAGCAADVRPWAEMPGAAPAHAMRVIGNYLLILDEAGRLSSYALTDGRLAWKRELPCGDLPLDYPTPIEESQHLGLVFPGGGMTCIEPATGNIRWRAANDAFPVCVSETLVLVCETDARGRNASLQRLDVSTGRKRWASSMPAAVARAAVVSSTGGIVLGTDGSITRIDLTNGSIARRQAEPGVSMDVRGGGGVHGSLRFSATDSVSGCAVGKSLAVAHASGRLWAFDPASDAVLWDQPRIAPGERARVVDMAFCDGVLVLQREWTGPFAEMAGLDAATGEVRWRRPITLFRVGSRMQVRRNELYACAEPNVLSRIDPMTGKDMWHARFPVAVEPPFAVGSKYIYAQKWGVISMLWRVRKPN
ncbi:MAG: PQQ-binding-like beta-propeller repeat protein [Phycisphaerae bacterium]|nr:PQQ-binding-like beta-propeller repeat protein [Phycisphaerae bacterium]